MHKKIFMVMALCASLLQVGAAEADYHVIPLPKQITMSKGNPFHLLPTTQIICTLSDDLMQGNVRFLCDYIKETAGLSLSVGSSSKVKTPAIMLVIDPKMQGDEAYKLSVSPKKLVISGRTPAGIFYGIQTLRKSLPIIKAGSSEPIMLPAAEITDAPRFAYRGMMLDCSRHFFSVDFVKRFIDLLALHNMNTFHWHLTDD